jgi:hypothetical protein
MQAPQAYSEEDGEAARIPPSKGRDATFSTWRAQIKAGSGRLLLARQREHLEVPHLDPHLATRCLPHQAHHAPDAGPSFAHADPGVHECQAEPVEVASVASGEPQAAISSFLRHQPHLQLAPNGPGVLLQRGEGRRMLTSPFETRDGALRGSHALRDRVLS